MKHLALALLFLVGCTGRTELVIGVATDLRAKGEIDLVRFLAQRNGTPVVQQDWPLADVPAGMYELPGSFGLYSPDGSEPRVELSVVGMKGTTVVADREAVLSLVSGKTLFLRMTITSACSPTSGPTCAADESCVEGVCQKREIDSHRLPAYRPELVTHTDCASNVHYIVSSTGATMPSLRDACPGGDECHEGTCWTPPSGTPQSNGDLAFCVATDGAVLPDGGISLVTSTDLRISDYPIGVGLICGQHFYPYEVALSAGDSLQFYDGDSATHHLRSSFFTTPDLQMGPASITFSQPGDFTVTCDEHPTAGTLTVHVQ